MFALIDKKTDEVIKYPTAKGVRIGDRLLVSPTVAGWENEDYRVLPVTEIDPEYDAATQIKSEWVVTVEADRVVRERTVTNKTAQQLEDEAAARKEGEIEAWFTNPNQAGYQLLAVIINEFNLHSETLRALGLAIVQSNSLAEIKTAIAAIDPIPSRTFADLVAAISNRLGQEESSNLREG